MEAVKITPGGSDETNRIQQTEVDTAADEHVITPGNGTKQEEEKGSTDENKMAEFINNQPSATVTLRQQGNEFVEVKNDNGNMLKAPENILSPKTSAELPSPSTTNILSLEEGPKLSPLGILVRAPPHIVKEKASPMNTIRDDNVSGNVQSSSSHGPCFSTLPDISGGLSMSETSSVSDMAEELQHVDEDADSIVSDTLTDINTAPSQVPPSFVKASIRDNLEKPQATPQKTPGPTSKPPTTQDAAPTCTSYVTKQPLGYYLDEEEDQHPANLEREKSMKEKSK